MIIASQFFMEGSAFVYREDIPCRKLPVSRIDCLLSLLIDFDSDCQVVPEKPKSRSRLNNACA